MNLKRLSNALVLLALVVPAVTQAPAQQRAPVDPAQQRTVSRFFVLQPKEGHSRQLEEGLKKHQAFHRQAGDRSQWHVWMMETGPEMGSYVVGSLGHQWKTLDQTELGEKDFADVEVNLSPHVAAVGSAIWVFRGDISPAPEGKPGKFTQVTYFTLHPDGVPVFENTIRRINEELGKLPAGEGPGGPGPMLYELYAGGEGPRLALVVNRKSWADFAPQGRTLMQALQAAMGEQPALEMMQAVSKVIRSSETQILRYRPDLSSPPGSER